jgi:nitroreductase
MAAVARHSAPDALMGSKPVRFEYIKAPLTVWPVVGGHEFLVAIAPKEYDRTSVIDVGRSLQRVVLDATRLGIATCWIGPGADHRSITAALGDRIDPDADHIICVCAVGYKSRFKPIFIRFMQGGQHRRRPLAKLFYADADFATPLDTDAAPFAAFGRTYEACEWSPSSFNSQTTRAVGVQVPTPAGGPARVRIDFYASTTSRYYAPVALGIWCGNWEYGAQAAGIRGHFAILDAASRGVPEPEPGAVPRYDVSWIADA